MVVEHYETKDVKKSSDIQRLSSYSYIWRYSSQKRQQKQNAIIMMNSMFYLLVNIYYFDQNTMGENCFYFGFSIAFVKSTVEPANGHWIPQLSRGKAAIALHAQL